MRETDGYSPSKPRRDKKVCKSCVQRGLSSAIFLSLLLTLGFAQRKDIGPSYWTDLHVGSFPYWSENHEGKLSKMRLIYNKKENNIKRPHVPWTVQAKGGECSKAEYESLPSQIKIKSVSGSLRSVGDRSACASHKYELRIFLFRMPRRSAKAQSTPIWGSAYCTYYWTGFLSTRLTSCSTIHLYIQYSI